MKETIKGLLDCAKFAKIGAIRKAGVLVRGEAPVPSSCQIPGVRSLYSRIGLRKRTGWFVEVGGYDGESFSNTAFLADEGWKGLYLEPILKFARLIRYRHFLNNVRVDAVGISDTNGTSMMIDMGALSSTNHDTVQAYSNISWAQGVANIAKAEPIRTTTLSDALTKARIPREFELIVVDVEGAEETVVRQLLESTYRPSVAIIELVDKHPDFVAYLDITESHARVRQAMIGEGYHVEYEDEINSVFTRT